MSDPKPSCFAPHRVLATLAIDAALQHHLLLQSIMESQGLEWEDESPLWKTVYNLIGEFDVDDHGDWTPWMIDCLCKGGCSSSDLANALIDDDKVYNRYCEAYEDDDTSLTMDEHNVWIAKCLREGGASDRMPTCKESTPGI